MAIDIIVIISLLTIATSLFLWKPRVAVLSMLPLIPLMHKELFSLYAWDYLPIRFYILGLGIGLLVSILVKLRNGNLHERMLGVLTFFKYDVFLYLLFALFLSRLLSTIISGRAEFAFSSLAFSGVVILLYGVIRFVTSRDKKLFTQLFTGYLGIAVLTNVFALVQLSLKLTSDIKIGAIWPVPNNFPRLGATFWDVNHFGGFLVTAIPLFIVTVFVTKSRFVKIMCITGTVVSSALLFLTQSRSSWLGIIVVFVFGIFLLFRKKMYKPLVVLFVTFLLGIFTFGIYMDVKDLSLRQKLASYMHYRLDSTDTHVMLIEGAVQVYLKSPLFGVGGGNFDTAFRTTKTATEYFAREPKLVEQKVPPHSVWGEYLSETGYVGFSIALILMSSLILGLLYLLFYTKEKNTMYQSIGLALSTIGIAVTGLFYSFNLEFFWLLLILDSIYILQNFENKYPLRRVLEWVSSIRWLPFVLIVPFVFFFFYLNLGGHTLIQWDESIYATVSKNILLTHDWMSLHWNSLDDYWFEKPPLYMWITAFLYQIAGVNEFAARLFAATSGVGGVFVVYLLGRKLYNRFVGFVSAIMLYTTAHYLYYARNAVLDVPVTFFSILGVYLFICAVDAKSRKRMVLTILSGIVIGLAILTKAIVGLLPLVTILIFVMVYIITQKKKYPFGLFSIVLLVAIGVAAPWHVYEYILHGSNFLQVYFIKHIFDRGVEGLGHAKSFLYYFNVVGVSYRIWIFPLIASFVLLPVFDKKKRMEMMFLFSTLTVIFVFFSVPKDKLVWYLIPIYPYFAIVSARAIDIAVMQSKRIFAPSMQKYYLSVRFLLAFSLLLFTPFYITRIRDKIFFEDENKDIVEIVKIFNTMYPIERYSDLKLRFISAPQPLLYFYSDHEPKTVSNDDVFTAIEKSQPDQNQSFVVTQKRFYDLKSGLEKEVNIPSDIRIKAVSGRYVIARSVSRVDLLREQNEEATEKLYALYVRNHLLGLTVDQKAQYILLRTQYYDQITKLTEFGYPTFAPTWIQ